METPGNSPRLGRADRAAGSTQARRQRPAGEPQQPSRLVAVAAGGLIMGKPFTTEARLRGQVTIQARADAFARSMADTIAELEREGITSSYGMAKALNERSVAAARSGRWQTNKVINLRRRLKRLGL